MTNFGHVNVSSIDIAYPTPFQYRSLSISYGMLFLDVFFFHRNLFRITRTLLVAGCL